MQHDVAKAPTQRLKCTPRRSTVQNPEPLRCTVLSLPRVMPFNLDRLAPEPLQLGLLLREPLLHCGA